MNRIVNKIYSWFLKALFGVGMMTAAFPMTVCAQTGITTGAGSTADAVHYQGVWTAGTTEYVNVDVLDSTADTDGYVNSLYAGGLARIYTAAGFETYGVYAQYVPTKSFAKLVKKTNIPTDSLRVYVRAGIGSTVPDTGNAFVTGFAGGGASYAITSSGSVVWNTIYGEYQYPGIAIVKTGMDVYLSKLSSSSTASVQSPMAAKLRRALHLQKAHLTAQDYYEAANNAH